MTPEEAARELEKLLDPGPPDDPNAWRDWGKRGEAEKLFAASRGWRLTPKAFRIGQLVRGSNQTTRIEDTESVYPLKSCSNHFDHPEWYRFDEKPYRPAGIVIHSYPKVNDQFRKEVTEWGLQLEILPKSWYHPTATAIVLTPLQKVGPS